jgi:hypothetical protein
VHNRESVNDLRRILAAIGLACTAVACADAVDSVQEERTPDERDTPNDGWTEDAGASDAGRTPRDAVADHSPAGDTDSGWLVVRDGGARSEVPSRDSANGLDSIEGVLLLDDAEDGDAALLWGGDLLGGHWFTFDDRQDCRHPDFASGNVAECAGLACAASGMIIPVPEAYGAPPLETWGYAETGVTGPGPEGTQRENERGLRVQASAHTFEGAGLAVDLQGEGVAYELTQVGAVGVRFLARSGIASSTIALSVEISDAYSDGAGGRCVLQASNCDELTCVCEGDVQGCGDHPAAPWAATRVDGEWRLYELLFSSFARAGSGEYVEGVSPPAELELSSARQLRFKLRTDGEPLPEFDLWLDDIGLIVDR